MDTPATNREYHELLDYLADRRFYGEVTFYFQNGIIESNRLSERNTKSEIREQMEAKKHHKAVIPRHAGGTA
jgi:hypothetical protein